jgi:hypothetical protein
MTTEPRPSTPPEPTLEQQDCDDERADQPELARAATLDRRPDHEDDGRDEQDRAARRDEERARAQAGVSWPFRDKRRFTQASGS